MLYVYCQLAEGSILNKLAEWQQSFRHCRAASTFTACCPQSEKQVYGVSINSNVTGSYVTGEEWKTVKKNALTPKDFFSHYFGNCDHIVCLTTNGEESASPDVGWDGDL